MWNSVAISSLIIIVSEMLHIFGHIEVMRCRKVINVKHLRIFLKDFSEHIKHKHKTEHKIRTLCTQSMHNEFEPMAISPRYESNEEAFKQSGISRKMSICRSTVKYLVSFCNLLRSIECNRCCLAYSAKISITNNYFLDFQINFIAL